MQGLGAEPFLYIFWSKFLFKNGLKSVLMCPKTCTQDRLPTPLATPLPLPKSYGYDRQPKP